MPELRERRRPRRIQPVVAVRAQGVYRRLLKRIDTRRYDREPAHRIGKSPVVAALPDAETAGDLVGRDQRRHSCTALAGGAVRNWEMLGRTLRRRPLVLP